MSAADWFVPPPVLPPPPTFLEFAAAEDDFTRQALTRPPLVQVYPSTVARAATIAQAGVIGAQP